MSRREVHTMKSVGEKIKHFREKSGLSQCQLADRIPSLNQSQLSKIETSRRGISVTDLILIAKALNTSIEKLLNEEEGI